MLRGGRNHIRLGRWTQITGVTVGLTIITWGCGGTTRPTATGGGKSTATASTVRSTTTSTTVATTTTAPTTTLPTTTTEDLPASPLRALLIPTPDGYALSHTVSVRNGPVTAAQFNQLMNSSTLATDEHYVDGYHVIYDSIAADDSIDLLVVQFATARDAKDFQAGFVPSNTAVSADYPGIPGADVFNSARANPDGGFDHGFIATKGARSMVIEDATSNAAPVPSLAPLAQAQYAKL